MNCLLDSRTFLWALFSPENLGADARELIARQENRIFVSTVSFREISLKFVLGRIELEGCTPDELPGLAAETQIEIVAPTAEESASFHQLSRIGHKDPFERMIVWQAIRQSLVLISKDANFPEYARFGLQVRW